jgi:hypothetical protein
LTTLAGLDYLAGGYHIYHILVKDDYPTHFLSRR